MDEKTGPAYAIERYEEALATQRERREQFTRRALRLSRINLLLLGASVTGISILIRNSQLSVTMWVGPIPLAPSALAFGGIGLLIALGFAVGTSKITVLIYSPPRELKEDRETRPAVNELYNEYTELGSEEIIRYYELVFRFNQKQLGTPALRLERAYVSLFLGTSWLTIGFLLLILPSLPWSASRIGGGLLALALLTIIVFVVFFKEYHRGFTISGGEIGPFDDEILELEDSDRSDE